MTNHAIGVMGESHAVRYLISEGYDILERNYRTKHGEIDIIAKSRNCLHIIEVKTWRKVSVQDLGLSINHKKKNRIVNTTKKYLLDKGIDLENPISFDVLLLNPDQGDIRHFINAYSESG